ncbi:MAG TPA: protein phosphatase CheZ [Hyphomonadaceae bacterium]|jgi:chemotaxis protein CheZ|nr:protein phosphatase CheZ [Hyphomonadaceae bacterium]HPN05378.1 protein phosphatase CheZ [Hyphomonadaceae bacterium]
MSAAEAVTQKVSAKSAAEKIKIAIDTLKASGVRERPLVEVLDLSHQMADAMKTFFGSLDRSIIGEFRYIADFIQKARDEISGLQANDIKDSRIPGASMELDAVVRDTERATETIMSEAEGLMNANPADLKIYKAEVDAAMLRIFEACSFQDLTGQRVNKVIATLRHIEERVSQFAGALGVTDTAQPVSAADQRAKDQLLNGPAINGPSTTQEDIDALFA